MCPGFRPQLPSAPPPRPVTQLPLIFRLRIKLTAPQATRDLGMWLSAAPPLLPLGGAATWPPDPSLSLWPPSLSQDPTSNNSEQPLPSRARRPPSRLPRGLPAEGLNCVSE